MNTTGPSNSPAPTPPTDATDAQLSAELKKWNGTTPAFHPVGELLDRHWEAAFAYARLCTGSGRAAGMLTTAAFTRLFGEALRQDGPGSAWRPHLLVTVRRIAAEWGGDGRRELLHPALRTAGGSPAGAFARLLPPPHRRTLSDAFQRLPQTARCVLWHTEVEAEPAAVPGALLGLTAEDVRIELRRARERLRSEALQVHRESAPQEECRHYLRLLDATHRRGGGRIDPDLRRHLDHCHHCRRTAGQLAEFDTGLGLALAEAVLGWAARDYVVARVRSGLGEPAATTPANGPEEAAAPGPAGGSRTCDGAAGGAGGRPDGADAGHAGTAPADALRQGPARTGAGRAAAAFRDATPGGGAVADAGRAGADPAGAGHRATAGTDTGHGEPAAADTGPGTVGRTGADSAPGPRRARFRAGPPPRPRSHATPGPRAERPTSGDRTAHRPATHPTAGHGGSRGASRRSLHRARAAARRRKLALAALTVSGLLALPLVLWAVGPDDDGTGPAAASPSAAPGTGAPTTGPSPIGAGAGTLAGRLRNAGSGLCVDIAGGTAVEGAETHLAACSAAPAQQWSYGTDGLLRSAAAPDLCLDSRLGYAVRLAPCPAAARSGGRTVRYDFTLQGALIPRSDQDLALTPAATDGSGALVLKNRAGDPAQRWTIDAVAPGLRTEVVKWAAAGPSPARGDGR